MSSDAALPERERRLNSVLAAYFEGAQTGKPFDPKVLIRQNPDLAKELLAFFADRQHVESIAAPPRLAQPPTGPYVPDAVPGAQALTGSTPVRRFGDYVLLEEIAHGGMGRVYKAHHIRLNRDVALKTILAAHLATPEAVQRFHFEAEAIAHLDHPNIIPIHEVGECEGQHYFSMKLITGTSLAKWLAEAWKTEPAAKAGPWTKYQREAVKTLTIVARAVHHAHQAGIIHRDLKPGNVLLDTAGTPLVADFGLAKRTTGDLAMTRTDAILGTPAYMAPEQASGQARDVTTAADIYSLGVILYEMLTGRTPFHGTDALDLLRQVRECLPEPPSKRNPKADRDLEAICLKCLEKVPNQRYSSAASLADDLQRWLRGEPTSVRPASAAYLAWRWLRKNVRSAVWAVGVGVACELLFVIGAAAVGNASAWRNICRGLSEQYASFPSLEPPWAARLDFEWLDWLTGWPSGLLWVAVVVGFFGKGMIGFLVVRPKDRWGDASAGLTMGLAISTFHLATAMSWAILVTTVIVPSLEDFKILAKATNQTTQRPQGAIPGDKQSDRSFTDRYPDLKQVPPEDRGNRLMGKILSDQISALVVGLWLAIFSSLAHGCGLGIGQTLIAGLLWRRHHRILLAVLQYLEVVFPFSLAIVFFQVMLIRSSNPSFWSTTAQLSSGYLSLMSLWLTGWAIVAWLGVGLRWPWQLRMACYAPYHLVWFRLWMQRSTDLQVPWPVDVVIYAVVVVLLLTANASDKKSKQAVAISI